MSPTTATALTVLGVVLSLASVAPLSAVEHLPRDVRLSLDYPESFRIAHALSAIPEGVRVAFARAVGEEHFAMAQPGDEWQATDIIEKSTLPRRRLAAIAASDSICLLFYELGGRGHSHHVVAFRLSETRAILVWRALRNPDVTDPATLLKAIEGGRIEDDPKYAF
jgi:hypothetical protein